MTWEEVCDDPLLQDLPYKIELNKWGNIEMSPARSHHAEYQGEIQTRLQALMKDGKAFPECPIETAENVKGPDVVWVSYARRRSTPRDPFYTIAPEICVEVVSPTNDPQEQMHKGQLYLQAGANEFWLCDQLGVMRFFNVAGPLERSQLCPEFPLRVELTD